MRKLFLDKGFVVVGMLLVRVRSGVSFLSGGRRPVEELDCIIHYCCAVTIVVSSAHVNSRVEGWAVIGWLAGSM